MIRDLNVRDVHATSAGAALDALASARVPGLDAAEVERRQASFGPNALPGAKRRSALMRFAMQFHNVLIYVLIAAGVVTLALGHLLDSAVIFGVVVINALIGHVQEGKAEQALDAIRSMLSSTAQVLRDGQRRALPAVELVPGDIVFLTAGDKVPADLRLLEVRSLRVDESALTGESVAVDKSPEPVAADAVLGDRRCMAFSGTLVTYGQAVGVVAGTGVRTELGRISALLQQESRLSTPLLREFERFGYRVTWVILALSAVAFGFGVLVRGYGANEMMLAAVGLAVAAIPEGLPAVMTIALAIGVKRMAARNAIIRRLPAVEALGSVTVVCSDKTGTLTRNEMSVQRILAADGEFAVSGVGYAPEGAITSADGNLVDPASSGVLELARAALLCNDASINHEAGSWVLNGDPTEGALIAFALKAGLDAHFEAEAFPRLDAIPFESEHRYMASLHHDHAGHRFVFLKGAPERVLELCCCERAAGEDRPLDRVAWNRAMAASAGDGMRLLALAVRVAAEDCDELVFADIDAAGFTLLGMLALSDPPRAEAIAAVRRCREAGIRVCMITGDHVLTAQAIGRQFGMGARASLSGAEIETMSDARLQEVVAEVDVYARASPEHKLRLVQALQARGEVVAMTGDGVNDAPALKRADIGVAMGCKGTEAAREAAEVVLADDNFASIAAAVEEGRTVYDNLRKAIVFILPTNGGQAMLLLAAIGAGLTLPITPAQVLWVNMITAVTLALALAFEPPEAGIMARPPREPSAPLLNRFLVWRVLLVSALLVAASLGQFMWDLAAGASLELARTAAVNALVVGEVAYLFSVRRLQTAALARDALKGLQPTLVAVAIVVLAQSAYTYLPAMQALFGSAPLDGTTWLRIVAIGVLSFAVLEVEKLVVARFGRETLAHA